MFFPHLPAVINVLLPDDSIAQWQITWHHPPNGNANVPASMGSIGQFASGCLNFYRNDFISLGYSNRIHKIELWEVMNTDTYMVEVFSMEVQ